VTEANLLITPIWTAGRDQTIHCERIFTRNLIATAGTRRRCCSAVAVTLLARDLNALVNSDLIRNLCPTAPPELAKAKWIQPGRSSWEWWSSGGPIYSEQHQWVDWTKQLGFEYYLIDEGWSSWRPMARTSGLV